MGEKINFYASHTLVHSLLNADVALSCPIQLYLTGLSDLGVGCVGTALLDLGRSVNPVSIRRADYAHHITDSPPGFQNPAASLPSNVVGIVYPLGGGAAPPPTPISDSPTVVCRLGVGVGTLLKISFQCYNSKGWNANPQVKRADHFDI